MKKQKGNVALVLICLLLVLAAILGAGYGWVHNIVALCGASFDHPTPLLILRFIGAIIFPLGIILGYI